MVRPSVRISTININWHSRLDLNPTTSRTDADPSDAAADESALPPPLGGESRPSHEDPAHRARRRAASLLHLHRLRTAPPDERIAALRQLREQTRAEGGTVEEVEEPSRARLADRLRDRFRIGTRQQPSAAIQDNTPQPSAPSNEVRQ